MLVTIVLLSLNTRGVYWQDLGQPNQSSNLQALQYAAKAQEIMVIASLEVQLHAPTTKAPHATFHCASSSYCVLL